MTHPKSFIATPATILIVADDPSVSQQARHALEQAGYVVFTARNAGETVQHLQRRSVDLLLLDDRVQGDDGPHSRVVVGKLKIGLIAQEKQPLLTNDVAHDPRISDPEWARREGMVAFAGYPLLVEDQLVGVLAMFARKPLTGTTLQAMGSVANQIALGIEHKRGEESLRATQDRLEHLISSSPAIIYSLKLEGEEVASAWVSENIQALLGYDPLRCNSQGWLDNLHPEDRAEGQRQIAELIQHGQLTSEYRFRDGQGIYHWICETTSGSSATQTATRSSALARGWRLASVNAPRSSCARPIKTSRP
jgi:PAS domain-containing protein